jgi:hypothetical protein
MRKEFLRANYLVPRRGSREELTLPCSVHRLTCVRPMINSLAACNHCANRRVGTLMPHHRTTAQKANHVWHDLDATGIHTVCHSRPSVENLRSQLFGRSFSPIAFHSLSKPSRKSQIVLRV